MDPPTFDIVRQTDALIRDLHRFPVERRRRVVKGLVRRLVRNAGVHRLDVLLLDQSSREQAEASLEHLFVLYCPSRNRTLHQAASGAAPGEPMPSKKRRSFTAAQKAAILRRHHVDKVPVSQLCEEEELQPSVFYYRQKQAFGNLEVALQPRGRPRAKEKVLEAKVEHLEARLARKDHVIAVVSEECVTSKKALGEP